MSMAKAALRAMARAEGDPRLAGRPSYHAIAPAGWMNDPNGLCHFGGLYHLFYQYNPYRARWGRMCWGHLVSPDLLTWSPRPPALVPEAAYESLLGCFSGGALVEGEALHLMYTGVSALGQSQCLATSLDGETFRKSPSNPVISWKSLPRGYGRQAFRDPRPFRRDGRYYCLVGAARRPGPRGQILLFRSEDLQSWDLIGPVLDLPESPMLECPDLVEVDGHDVLICSPKALPARGLEFHNLHSSVYLAGRLDLATGRFDHDGYREMDFGTDFYAPQAFLAPGGRTIMVGWMGMWKRSVPTEAQGWAGAMTLPRVLGLREGRLLQRPVQEVEGLRRGCVSHRGIMVEGSWAPPGRGGDSVELGLDLDVGEARAFTLAVLKEGGKEVGIRWDGRTGRLGLDLGQAGMAVQDLAAHRPVQGRWAPVALDKGRLSLRVFLDASTLEVFAQDGAVVLSARVYHPRPRLEAGIELRVEGRAKVLAYDLHDLGRIGRPPRA